MTATPKSKPHSIPESLLDGAQALDARAVTALRRACAEAGLSDLAAARVERAATIIRSQQHREDRAGLLKTPGGLAKHLGSLAKKADELHALIAGFRQFDQERLHEKMIAAAVNDGRLREPARPAPAAIRAIAHDVAELGKAAQALGEEVARSSKAGGRRKTAPGLEMAVGLVWQAVEGAGMTVGRGGPFERLCEAVFEAAGVPSLAAGPVRKFAESPKAPPSTQPTRKKSRKR